MDAATSRLGKGIARISLLCSRYPLFTVLVFLALAAASVILATTRLAFRVHRDDMIRDTHPVQVAWKGYLALNGPDDDLVVVVEGRQPERITAAIDRIAEELRARPHRFDRVMEKVDPSQIKDRALQLLPLDKLAEIELSLKEMKPLFDLPFGWNLFTLQSLLIEAKTKLRNITIGRKISAGDERFLEGFKRILDCALGYLASPGAYTSPWGALRPQGIDPHLSVNEPTYFFNAQRNLAFLSVRPIPSPDNFMAPYLEGVTDARHLLDQVRHEFSDLRMGLTGLPALECDEMEASKSDTNRASWLALGLVFGLYLLVFRGLRIPLLTVVPLVIGTLLALGLAAVAIGHLNLLSATFGLMLIGVGDYGILWISRFDQEMQSGRNPEQATQTTASSMGTAIVFAALTMAIAFGATTFADFQAVAELGFIAGCGTLLCGLTSITLLPALLSWFGPGLSASSPPGASTLKLPQKTPFLPRLPRGVLPIAGLVVVGLVPFALQLGYDSNLLHLQSQELESVVWQNRLLEACPQATWHAVVVAKDKDEAIQLTNILKKLPEVSSVAETASLVPADPEATSAAVNRIQATLAKIPKAGQTISIGPLQSRGLLKEVVSFQNWLESDASQPRRTRDFDEIQERLERLETMLNQSNPTIDSLMTAFDQKLVTDLLEQLNQLKEMSSPKPLTEKDWPANLLERFQAQGQYFLRVFPAFDTWDFQGLTRFTDAVSRAVPQATGKPFTTRVGLELMRDSFIQAAWYAFFSILVIITLELRHPGHVLLALFPLASGLTVSLALMSLLGVDLNPANMIGLPLLVGIGVDNGLHLVHDFRSRNGPYRLDTSVFRGIAIASATTALGFGCLMVSSHRGLASLGLLLSTGVLACSGCALLLLPALFEQIRAKAQPKKTTLAPKPSQERAKAA